MTSGLIDAASLPRLNTPTIQRFPNGLTVIAEQMPVEAVNLSLWLSVGSAVEPDPINGMAHFLEHMIFKGTNRLRSGEFEQLIEQRGAVTNAATSQDYTHYYITTAPKDFAELAPLQTEVVLNAAIPDEAFERERSVILEEIRRANDNPGRRTFYRSMEMAFDRLPYRRPVLGFSEVIEQLTPQQMRDFHAKWYRPSSISAVAVGNLPVDQLIQIVAQGFEHVDDSCLPGSNPTKTANSRLTETVLSGEVELESSFEGVSRRDYYDAHIQQARLFMAWRVPGMAHAHQTYALDVLASILGQGRTARLIRDLRENRGLVSGISVGNMTYAMQGVFYVSVHLPEENLADVEEAIAHHIRVLHDEPVSESEIARVRTLVANRYIFGNETPSNRAGLYGYYQSISGDVTPALNYPAHIQALDAHDLQTAARQYLSPDAYGVSTFRPASA
ncbi:MAG TPA: M16 family metallopeptidase [Elainellaceae cyanobacterium]